MRPRIGSAVGVALVGVVLSACTGSSAIVAPPTVREGRLTVCTAGPYPPFVMVGDGGRVSGIDPDLSRAVATELALEADFVDLPFGEVFPALDNSRCDVAAAAVSITEDRLQRFLFTDGYFQVVQSVLVRTADAETYSSLDRIPGMIGVQVGTTGAGYAAARVPSERLRQFEDATEMVQALRAGTIDGIVQDRPVNDHLARSPDFRMVAGLDDGISETYGMVLAKRSTALRDAVNEALRRMMADGRYDAILKNHLGGAPQ